MEPAHAGTGEEASWLARDHRGGIVASVWSWFGSHAQVSNLQATVNELQDTNDKLRRNMNQSPPR